MLRCRLRDTGGHNLTFWGWVANKRQCWATCIHKLQGSATCSWFYLSKWGNKIYKTRSFGICGLLHLNPGCPSLPIAYCISHPIFDLLLELGRVLLFLPFVTWWVGMHILTLSIVTHLHTFWVPTCQSCY